MLGFAPGQLTFIGPARIGSINIANARTMRTLPGRFNTFFAACGLGQWPTVDKCGDRRTATATAAHLH